MPRKKDRIKISEEQCQQLYSSTGAQQVGIDYELFVDLLIGIFKCWRGETDGDITAAQVQSILREQTDTPREKARYTTRLARRIRVDSHRKGTKLSKAESEQQAARMIEEFLAESNNSVVSGFCQGVIDDESEE